jgi:hypothetical protein
MMTLEHLWVLVQLNDGQWWSASRRNHSPRT